MIRPILLAVSILAFSTGALWAQAGGDVETLVCIRHGEKPQAGLGQLTARGLNRALALPKVLVDKFGKPQFLFAPDPARVIHDKGVAYSYIRPLATIEPTAIYLGMPVNTSYGEAEIDSLQKELALPQYKDSVIFIAWEHVKLHQFVQNLLTAYGGDVSTLPPWPGADFDTILVVKIARHGDAAHATLTVDHENLNGVSSAFPAVTP